MRYAIVADGVVTSVTLWDGESEWTPPEGSTAVECGDDVATGWTYDGTDFTAPETPAVSVILNKVDFLRLFTQSERIAIRAAAAVNAQVADYQDILANSAVVLLDDPGVMAGVPLLEAAGLIGTGRAAQILAGEAP